ncbi:hypothetical protein LCGC14_0338380 [marine sediment metagenome]|uniref:Uncharacterized protein n=1 Tax=marine sediment metagenome TaxID=412755 RepID=A0A0F9TK13_9ZZZZ
MSELTVEQVNRFHALFRRDVASVKTCGNCYSDEIYECHSCCCGTKADVDILIADWHRQREIIEELYDPEPGNCQHCEPIIASSDEGTNHYRHMEGCVMKSAQAAIEKGPHA